MRTADIIAVALRSACASCAGERDGTPAGAGVPDVGSVLPVWWVQPLPMQVRLNSSTSTSSLLAL